MGETTVEVEPDTSGTDPAVGGSVILGVKAWAALKADTKSPCDSCEVYAEQLLSFLEERLLILLQGEPAVGGMNLRGTLQQQEPLTIDSIGQLQTTEEHWRWENCRKSLETKGLYEAPGVFSGCPKEGQNGLETFSQPQASRMEGLPEGG